MWRDRATRRAVLDARVAVISVSAGEGEWVRLATKSGQNAEKVRQSGRTEYIQRVVCKCLMEERKADDTNIDYVCHGEYHDETSGKKLNEAEVMKARREEFA